MLSSDAFFQLADRLVAEHGGHVDKHIGDCVMAVFGAPDLPWQRCRARRGRRHRDPGRHARAVGTGRASACRAHRRGRWPGRGQRHRQRDPPRVHGHRRYGEPGLAPDRRRAGGCDADLAQRARGIGVRAGGGGCRPAGRQGLRRAGQQAWRVVGRQLPSRERGPLVGRLAELGQLRALIAPTPRRVAARPCWCVARRASARPVWSRRRSGRPTGTASPATSRLGARLRRCHRARCDPLALAQPAGGRQRGRPGCRRGSNHGRRRGRGRGPGVPQRSARPPQPPALRAVYQAMDNARRHRGKREVMARVVEWACRARPRLLVVEDVHWADRNTLAHLARLAVVARECPCLLLLTTRLDGDPIDAAWRVEAAGCVADDHRSRAASPRRGAVPRQVDAGHERGAHPELRRARRRQSPVPRAAGPARPGERLGGGGAGDGAEPGPGAPRSARRRRTRLRCRRPRSSASDSIATPSITCSTMRAMTRAAWSSACCCGRTTAWDFASPTPWFGTPSTNRC